MTHLQQASRSTSESDAKRNEWPDWTGRTAALIATGPSLTERQLQCVRFGQARCNFGVIAINEAGLQRMLPLAYPRADILYAADRAWWTLYQPQFSGLRVSGEPVEGIETIPLTMLQRNEAMPKTPGAVVHGGHGGFQALGLALTLGVRRILLLGYDCRKIDNRRNATANQRSDYMNRLPNFDLWQRAYNKVPAQFPDVEILNCSLDSALTMFPKIRIEDVSCE